MSGSGRPAAASRPPLDFRSDADRFDPEWYRAAYSDLPGGDSGDALAHFVAIGSREGRQPNGDFAAEWYIERLPRVAAAVEAGRLCGPFHDYLLRRRQGLPRRAAPASVAIGVDLESAEPYQVDLVLRLADRAPGWDFWLLAPPGCLPSEGMGANISIAASAAGLPPIDLWLDLGRDDGASLPATSVALAPLMERLGYPPTELSAPALERALEVLRRLVLAGSPLIPTRRRDSGPVHLDPARVSCLRITVRRLDPKTYGGGVVMRSAGGIVAELPPPGDSMLEAAIDVRGIEDLWLTVSCGLLVELILLDPPPAGLDLIVTGQAGQRREAWQRTLESAGHVGGAGHIVVVAPPSRLDLPARTVVRPSLAEALADRHAPAMLVPVGVRLFPQAVTQASARLGSGGHAYTCWPAIRHPDGHLAPWPSRGSTADPELFTRWSRGCVTVLSAAGRRRAARQLAANTWRAPEATDAAALAAIDADAWPFRLRRRRAQAPGWLRLDTRPDGGVIGSLRLHGSRLADGGRLLLTGRTDSVLAAPCLVVARSLGKATEAATLARFLLPASSGFVWPIDLPAGANATEVVEIAADGPWRTAQVGKDARPMLFRLIAVSYRPPSPSTSPSATSRVR